MVTLPFAGCSPHARGMVPVRAAINQLASAAPRTRGDGPPGRSGVTERANCSPHARGWSQVVRAVSRSPELLPARAGMVPRRPGSPTGLRCAPRTRGYGPSCAPNPTCSLTCSPHARGWPPVHGRLRPGRSLLPARAGMVPPRRRSTGSCGAAPRTRGDGPPPAAARAWPRSCSPHARGWSRWDRHRCQGADLLPHARGWSPPRRLAHVPRGLLPARAGMVPCA